MSLLIPNMWVIDGIIEINSEQDRRISTFRKTIINAMGSICKMEDFNSFGTDLEEKIKKLSPESVAVYYSGPEKIKILSLCFPTNQVPVEVYDL